jgi:hypothetical protein
MYRDSFVAKEPLILISIGKTYETSGMSVYDCVRAAWRIDKAKAETYGLVLAHYRGEVVGAFRPESWLVAMKSSFPRLSRDYPDRFGFTGTPAEQPIQDLYVCKLVPDDLRRKGAANPVRFVRAS